MNTFDNRYMALQIEKLKMIMKKQQSVSSVALELNVSRQTIHTWLNRYKRFGIDGLLRKKRKRNYVTHNKTSLELEQLVIQLSQTYWNDGVQTLADHLQYENNITLNASTIYRILKRNNIRYTTKYPHTRKKLNEQRNVVTIVNLCRAEEEALCSPSTWNGVTNGHQVSFWLQTRTSHLHDYR